MAYDEKLATRIREVLAGKRGITEKKMFGGLAFMVNGKMFAGVLGNDLMVRVGAENYEEALTEPHVRAMDLTGRPMTGFILVGPAGHRARAALEGWVNMGRKFAAKLE